MPQGIEEVALELKRLLTYTDVASIRASQLDSPHAGNQWAGSGISIESRKFHHFQSTTPPWRTLAVDASLKTILDCGAFLVVLLKAAFEIWQLGTRRVLEGIETHVQIFRSILSAREHMATLEFGLAAKTCRHLSEGDIILLDRPLYLKPSSSVVTLREARKLSEELDSRHVGMLGICKSSRLRVGSGAPMIGFLLHEAAQIKISLPWIYYPLKDQSGSKFQFGSPSVASFDAMEDFAFRVDLGTTLNRLESALTAMGSVAALGDKFAYGYPYPLRSVHEACSISRTEVDICRQRLLEAASARGFLPNLKYALKATAFREEVLLSQ